jgi:hypothetical protein
VWTGMIAWESEINRETAIEQATDFSNSIHEMTMAGLNRHDDYRHGRSARGLS